MRTLQLCLLSCAAIGSPLLAEPIKFKPLIDTRLRYENVDQTGIAREADALTARGVPVRHIMSATKADLHKLTSFARVEGNRVTYPPPEFELF